MTLYITVLMPCLNEVETLEFCVNEARSYLQQKSFDWEIVISDNGSTDGSIELAEKLGCRVVHAKERGYGSALRAGINAAAGNFIIFGDCDGSYDFSKLDAFLQELENGWDLVMGNRFLGHIEPGAMPILNRWIGNPALSFIARVLFKLTISDFHCGIRGFRSSLREEVNFQTTGMEFATEMVVVISRFKGAKITEVPTSLRKDLRSRPPHLRPWRDGWRHLRYMIAAEPSRGLLLPAFCLFLPTFALYLMLLMAGEIKLGSTELSTRTLFLSQTISSALIAVMFIGHKAGLSSKSEHWDRNFDKSFVIGGGLALLGIIGMGLGSLYWIFTGSETTGLRFESITTSASLFMFQSGISIFSISMTLALTNFFHSSKNEKP